MTGLMDLTADGFFWEASRLLLGMLIDIGRYRGISSLEFFSLIS